jgi:hypothetical protein
MPRALARYEPDPVPPLVIFLNPIANEVRLVSSRVKQAPSFASKENINGNHKKIDRKQG